MFIKERNEKARYFSNVVNKFFIGQVQVYAVQLNQRYNQIMGVYINLEDKLKVGSPKQYDEWKAQRDKQFKEYLIAPKGHVFYIQKLYEQCALHTDSEI